MENAISKFAHEYIDDLIYEKDVLLTGIGNMYTHFMEKGDKKGMGIALKTLQNIYLKDETKNSIDFLASRAARL